MVAGLKARLAAGETCFGTMIFEFATTGISRAAAAAGAEFVIFDMEHTGWSSDTLRMLLGTTRETEIVPIVRVPANQYHLISTQLDLGARGVMLPMVESSDSATAFVASTRYPPSGRRGAAFAIAHDDYKGGDIEDKIAAANANVLTIAQIETPAGVEAVDEIAAVDGLDMLWFGQFDLSNFMGVSGRFDDPAYVEAIGRIAAAAERRGKHLGALAMDVADAERWIDLGCSCIAYGGDVWLYQRALSDGLRRLRGTS